MDESFLRAIAPLRQPDMGAELMGPLLYSLVRSTRPRRLLEVGMGYTTPFLLKALADNAVDAARDREQMVAKTRATTARLSANRDPAAGPRILDEWFRAEPSLGSPAFYLAPYQPKLFAIDLLSHPTTTAGKVKETVEALGFAQYLELHIGDFRGMGRVVAPDAQALDFVWFDCGGYPEYIDFLAEYWDLISEDGGVLILHSTLNDYALGCVMRDLKIRQAADPSRMELINLVEPHKAGQGSFTMVRKIARFRDPWCEPARVMADAQRLMDAVG